MRTTPVLRDRSAPRVRIQIVELAPNTKGILQKGASANMTVYSITLEEAQKIINKAFETKKRK